MSPPLKITCYIKHHYPTPSILLSIYTYVTQYGWTPVMVASQKGHVDVVNILLKHGAKANHKSNVRRLMIQNDLIVYHLRLV